MLQCSNEVALGHGSFWSFGPACCMAPRPDSQELTKNKQTLTTSTPPIFAISPRLQPTEAGGAGGKEMQLRQRGSNFDTVLPRLSIPSLCRDRCTDRCTDRCKNCTDRRDREKGVPTQNPLFRGLYGLYSFYNDLYNGLCVEPARAFDTLVFWVRCLRNKVLSACYQNLILGNPSPH